MIHYHEMHYQPWHVFYMIILTLTIPMFWSALLFDHMREKGSSGIPHWVYSIGGIGMLLLYPPVGWTFFGVLFTTMNSMNQSPATGANVISATFVLATFLLCYHRIILEPLRNSQFNSTSTF